MEIRRLSLDDVPAVLRLARAAGWNQTAADVRRLLDLAPGGCFAACVGGELVGTTSTTAHGPALAWVGMVLVDPAHRRRGIATALMEAALAHLRQRGVATVKLDATPAGRPLYERLGFLPDGLLERWEGALPSEDTAEVSSGQWKEIAVMDRAAFGAGRGALVQRMIADAQPLLVARGAGGVTGYALARPGARAGYIGPLVAGGLSTARSLLLSASTALGGGPVYADIDTAFRGATELASGLGLTRQRELFRMHLGPPVEATGPLRVFAIAGPAVG